MAAQANPRHPPQSPCLYQPPQVRELDRLAIAAGTPGYELMQRAGRAAYSLLRARYPRARRLVVVCGIGNNAGDGYVLARAAREDGLEVRVLQLGDPARLSGDARRAADADAAAGGAPVPFAAAVLDAADVVVDAIFGTGLDRPVQGDWAKAIDAVNASERPVLALDVPSGLHGGSGAVLGTAVQASATATFIGRKAGLYTGAGPQLCGTVNFYALEVPAQIYEQVGPFARLLDDTLLEGFGRRRRDAHKGDFGHVLVIGGERGMGGAARLAAEAAARVGAGLVSVATRTEHVSALLAARPELMVHGVEDVGGLEPLLARASVLALGPGLGRGEWGRGLFAQALRFDGPMVVDADALNLLSEAPGRGPRWILTPHPGEAARLLGADTARIQQDRFAAAEALVARYGGVALLKGAGSVIHAGADARWVCTAGNPGMASGGMGDALTGVLAGLLAQGLEPLEAAKLGAQLHGRAADAAAAADGERGLLASDLLPQLRRLVNA